MLVAVTEPRDMEPRQKSSKDSPQGCCLWLLTCWGCPGVGRQEQEPTTQAGRGVSHQSGPGLHPSMAPNSATVPGTLWEVYGIAMSLDTAPPPHVRAWVWYILLIWECSILCFLCQWGPHPISESLHDTHSLSYRVTWNNTYLVQLAKSFSSSCQQVPGTATWSISWPST